MTTDQSVEIVFTWRDQAVAADPALTLDPEEHDAIEELRRFAETVAQPPVQYRTTV